MAQDCSERRSHLTEKIGDRIWLGGVLPDSHRHLLVLAQPWDLQERLLARVSRVCRQVEVLVWGECSLLVVSTATSRFTNASGPMVAVGQQDHRSPQSHRSPRKDQVDTRFRSGKALRRVTLQATLLASVGLVEALMLTFSEEAQEMSMSPPSARKHLVDVNVGPAPLLTTSSAQGQRYATVMPFAVGGSAGENGIRSGSTGIYHADAKREQREPLRVSA